MATEVRYYPNADIKSHTFYQGHESGSEGGQKWFRSIVSPTLGMQSEYMEIVSSNNRTNQHKKLATKKKRFNFRSPECRLVKLLWTFFFHLTKKVEFCLRRRNIGISFRSRYDTSHMKEISSNMVMGRIRNPDHFVHKRGPYLHACSSIVARKERGCHFYDSLCPTYCPQYKRIEQKDEKVGDYFYWNGARAH